MLFIRQPQTAEDIRGFCARFNEGFRVEYKGTLDDNVRRALPKVISSFANSLGGVLVVGVRAVAGVPQPPIEGFEPPEREELPLTVQSICLQNIFPPVFPRCYVVPSDIRGRVFLVVEVEESWEAPHAIENSKKAFVRTGDAANPYDLADVDLIIELIKRRQEPLKLRENLLARARRHASIVVAHATQYCEIAIGPSFPRRALCSSEECWEFIEQSPYRGGHFFPRDAMRRIADGAAAFPNREYGELSRFGLILVRNELAAHNLHEGLARPEVRGFLIGDVFHPLFKTIVCASRFYNRLGYRGNAAVQISIRNMMNQRLLFIPIEAPFYDLIPNDFLCFDDSLVTEHYVASENLEQQRAEIIQGVLAQICWSFWQASESFPSERFRTYIRRIVEQMRI